jgi:hypothetical protein
LVEEDRELNPYSNPHRFAAIFQNGYRFRIQRLAVYLWSPMVSEATARYALRMLVPGSVAAVIVAIIIGVDEIGVM